MAQAAVEGVPLAYLTEVEAHINNQVMEEQIMHDPEVRRVVIELAKERLRRLAIKDYLAQHGVPWCASLDG